jgi:hypothetical protein
MKKLFLVLGIIFAIIIALFIIVNGQGNKFDRDSKDYVDKNIPIIVSSLDYKELTSRASSELLNAVSEEKLKEIFDVYKEKLGKFKEHKGSQGESFTKIEIFSKDVVLGLAVTATYLVDMSFENAPARAKIDLILKDSEWKINGFQISSEAFRE